MPIVGQFWTPVDTLSADIYNLRFIMGAGTRFGGCILIFVRRLNLRLHWTAKGGRRWLWLYHIHHLTLHWRSPYTFAASNARRSNVRALPF